MLPLESMTCRSKAQLSVLRRPSANHGTRLAAQIYVLTAIVAVRPPGLIRWFSLGFACSISGGGAIALVMSLVVHPAQAKLQCVLDLGAGDSFGYAAGSTPGVVDATHANQSDWAEACTRA